MSFYGLNRATFNGGVSGIIAGAALVMAVGSTSAAGIRNVCPTVTINPTSQITGSGLRTALGDGGFIVGSAVSAFPALLQLQSANIYSLGTLQATPTSAWAISTGSVQGTGFIIRPGAGVSSAVATVVSSPVITLGFTSTIYGCSKVTADASVKLNGQSTWQRDGYAINTTSSNLTGLGLKTALGYSLGITQSSCSTDSIKIHGGYSVIQGICTLACVPSTDAAFIQSSSQTTAQPLVTVSGAVTFTGLSLGSAAQTVTTFGNTTPIDCISTVTAASRLALLGTSTVISQSDLTVDATKTLFGTGYLMGVSEGTAQWALLIESSAAIRARVLLNVIPFTNAEALDPDHRTMFREPIDRTMVRPFIDREMRRLA